MTADPILVVDSEPETRSVITETLEGSGYAVESVPGAVEAMEMFTRRRFGLIIADDGSPVLSEVKSRSPRTPVIMVTGSGSVVGAVNAMKAGASDYILKPFSPDVIRAAVRNASRAAGNGGEAGRPGADGAGDKPVVARSPSMRRVLSLAEKVAPSRSTVLIQGESGTGKEVLAAHIHRHSGRRRQPFVAVNCAALPDTLAESELFGHEKGAFTGAFARKAGKFEQASSGTLLLDEIGEMSPPLQAKLLRVLQEGQVDRIGGVGPVPVDTRIIAVTNADLKQAVKAGDFREDLFYRINVVPISLPPLRDRREDIPALADHFLQRYNLRNGGVVRRLADDTLAVLERHSWPGNVRELENAIERAVLLCTGDTLLPDDLMLDVAVSPSGGFSESGIRAGISVREMEKRLIFETLREVADNRTQAAELLGISIRTLRNKLNEYRSSA